MDAQSPAQAIPEDCAASDVWSPPEFGDVMELADRAFTEFKQSAQVILYALLDEWYQHGPTHGMTVAGVADSYTACVQDLMPAARYLRDRGLITMEMQAAGKEGCDCASCTAHRAWITLPYSFDADARELASARREEALKAQREATRIVNQQRAGQGFVYLLTCGPRYKIGVTSDIDRRLEQLRGQSPFPLEIVHFASGHDYVQMEGRLHRRYAHRRVHGEWFELSSDEVADLIEVLNEWARTEASH